MVSMVAEEEGSKCVVDLREEERVSFITETLNMYLRKLFVQDKS